MIREGNAVTTVKGTNTNLLDMTQFSTITAEMLFVVRLVEYCSSAAGTTCVAKTSYEFRRGSDKLSQGSPTTTVGGIGQAEDAEIFRGRIGPGNLYLEVTTPAAADAEIHFDITAYPA